MIAQKILNKVGSIVVTLERRPKLAGSILAIIFLALFSWLQRHPTILDSDAFYHAKMAEFLSHGILVRDFVWLPLTILKDHYADHHFFYHVILVPFVKFFDPLIGLKVAIVVLGTVAMMTYFLAMRRWKVIGAFWWTLLVATAWPFLFRLNLVKALPLSLIIYLLGLWCLSANRKKLLAIVSFVYVWTYGGWPLLLVAVGIYSAGLLIIGRAGWRESLAPLAWALLGNIAGIIINPYFPANIIFFKRQIIDIALIPTTLSGVGREWFRFPLFELFTAVAPLFIMSLIIIIFVTISWLSGQSLKFYDIREKVFSLTVGAMAIAIFILTLLSQRYIEYFVPLGYLAVALWVSVLVRSEVMMPFYKIIDSWLLNYRRYMLTVIILIISIFFIYIGKGVVPLDKRFSSGWSLTYLKGAVEWQQARLPKQTLVYNLRWDDFPELFYFGDSLHYVSGLDIRFFSDNYSASLAAWEKLYQGTADDPANLIRQTFGANYVLVSHFYTEEAIKMFETNNFPVIYKDDEATIYALP